MHTEFYLTVVRTGSIVSEKNGRRFGGVGAQLPYVLAWKSRGDRGRQRPQRLQTFFFVLGPVRLSRL